jgi:hypothetical protein
MSQCGSLIACGSTKGSGLTPDEGPLKRREVRDRSRPLQVYVTPAERTALQANARQAGMRMSHYLRAVGTAAQIRSVVDLEAVASLAKVHADQGRLGRLLKMYLQDAAPDRLTAQRLLAEIESTQIEIRAVLKRITP